MSLDEITTKEIPSKKAINEAQKIKILEEYQYHE